MQEKTNKHVPGVICTSFLYLDQTMKDPRLVLSLIAVSTSASLLLNWYGLTRNITNVLPHLLYIPIILTAYYYPRRGILFTVILSAIYGALVLGVGSPSPVVIVAALARVVVFLSIGAVVSFLSDRMQQDAGKCLRFVSMVESSNDAVVGKTLDGIITDWNSGAERLYGYTAREVLGKPVSLLSPPDRPDEIPRLIARIQSGERIGRYETDRVTKDGRLIQVSLSLSPIRNANGVIIGISTTAHDVTEKKRLQDEILKAKDEWERTFDAVPDLISIIDRDHRIVRVNKSMADRLGTHPEDVVGRLCYETVHHSGVPPRLCPHQLLISDGKEHVKEIHEDTLNGEFLVTASPLRDASGTVTGCVHVLHDITEPKRAEKALQQALKKLNMLSSITRHDILNQLMVLGGYLVISKESVKDPEILGFIQKEEEAVTSIRRQIEFTRYYEDIGVNAPQWQEITKTVRSSAAQLPLGKITLEIMFSGVEVFADPLISKVFYNLMENSIRHGDHVTRIWFRFNNTDAGGVITYEDDGAGIPARDKELIFRRGFGKHTGLGLFLSREILAITGITIRENGEPGKGVKFEILVPHDMCRVVQ
ncbi:MAG TPA: PAS domain S-box protein [Methanoregula sp.]|nr:PAS domain S-box protein [Methanoregula sp.]